MDSNSLARNATYLIFLKNVDMLRITVMIA